MDRGGCRIEYLELSGSDEVFRGLTVWLGVYRVGALGASARANLALSVLFSKFLALGEALSVN